MQPFKQRFFTRKPSVPGEATKSKWTTFSVAFWSVVVVVVFFLLGTQASQYIKPLPTNPFGAIPTTSSAKVSTVPTVGIATPSATVSIIPSEKPTVTPKIIARPTAPVATPTVASKK